MENDRFLSSSVHWRKCLSAHSWLKVKISSVWCLILYPVMTIENKNLLIRWLKESHLKVDSWPFAQWSLHLQELRHFIEGSLWCTGIISKPWTYLGILYVCCQRQCFFVQDGNTALHIATRMGHEKLADMLLKAGSVVTTKNNVGFCPFRCQNMILCTLLKNFPSGQLLSNSNSFPTSSVSTRQFF